MKNSECASVNIQAVVHAVVGMRSKTPETVFLTLLLAATVFTVLFVETAYAAATPFVVSTVVSTTSYDFVVAESADQAEKYDLYYEDTEYKYALYEPIDECYIGADITSGKKIPMDIDVFEQMTGKEHAIYMATMRIDEPFPLNWALECVSNGKTPCVVIEPLSQNILQLEKYEQYIENLAEQMGEYYIPIFAQLLPASRAYESGEYISLFRKASEIFKKRASNVALVFTANAYDALDMLSYYPGSDYVDWVGINIYQAIEQDKYSFDSLKALDLIYYNFQKEKPIMVSQLAISHFSATDHIYRTAQAKTEIERVYNAVLDNYPRVKCVIYRDINAMDIGSEMRDNFSITDNSDMLGVYKRIIENSSFVSDINMNSMNTIGVELMKSPFGALKTDTGYYLADSALLYDLNMVGVSSFGSYIYVDGQSYYHADILKSMRKSLLTDDIKKRAIITAYKPTG